MTDAQSSEVLSASELTVLVRALQSDLAAVRADVRALEGLRDGITAGAASGIAGLAAEMHALSESMDSLHEMANDQGEVLARQGESLAMLVGVNAATTDLQEFVRGEFEQDRAERAAIVARDQKARVLRIARDKQRHRWAINGYRWGSGVAVPVQVSILVVVIGNALQRLSALPPRLFVASTGAILIILVAFIAVFLIFFRPPELDDGVDARSSDSASENKNESENEKETGKTP